MSTSEAVRVFGSTLAGQQPAPRISSSSSKPRGCSSLSHEAAVSAGGDQAQRDRSCLYIKLGLQKNQDGHVLQIVFLPILFPSSSKLALVACIVPINYTKTLHGLGRKFIS